MLQVLASAPTLAVDVTCVPSVNQIDSVPELVSRHSMSMAPSLLKSPTPWTTKLLVTLPRAMELVTWPFCTTHSAISPALSRQKMLPFVSPTMAQVLGMAPKLVDEATAAPFINQTETVPLVLPRHSRSP